MKYRELVEKIGEQPLFSSRLLLAGKVDVKDVEKQLSRWSKAGKIHKLRKGLYSLALREARIKPHPFLISNALVQGSYVSTESALAYYNLIPEYPQSVTAVGFCRPQGISNFFGNFIFQHIKKELLFGYAEIEIISEQKVLISLKEKALIDLLYLRTNSDAQSFIEELRLQNLADLDFDLLNTFANRLKSPKVQRAIKKVSILAKEEQKEFGNLYERNN